jgi:hypothetical protein
MKHVLSLLALFCVGILSAELWLSGLASVLLENGCQLTETEGSDFLSDSLRAGIYTALFYPSLFVLLLGLSKVGFPQSGERKMLVMIILGVIGAELGALLRAMITIKITLQDAFANGEITPIIDIQAIEISTWMFYGLLSSFVLMVMVLIPLTLLNESES